MMTLLAAVTNVITITWLGLQTPDLSHYHIYVKTTEDFRMDDLVTASVQHDPTELVYTSKVEFIADAADWFPTSPNRGVYVTVRAVDIAGNISETGNIVQYKDIESPPPVTTTKILYER